jgi:hypothetical protein
MTLEYMQQRQRAGDAKNTACFDSKVVGQDDVSAAISFVGGIAKRLVQSSQKAIVEYLHATGASVTDELSRAIDVLGRWDNIAVPNTYESPFGQETDYL